MENAGRGAADLIAATFPDLQKRKVAVVAGKGNNGGDGFVIARYFLNRGISAKVYLLTDPKALRGDAETNFHTFQLMKGEVIPVPSSKDYQKVRKDLERFDLLIDGIFGTGLDAEVRVTTGKSSTISTPFKNRSLPSTSLPVWMPTPENPSHGDPSHADGHLRAAQGGASRRPRSRVCGELKVLDIGIPKKLVEEEKIQTNLLENDKIQNLLSIHGASTRIRGITDISWSSPDRSEKRGRSHGLRSCAPHGSGFGHPGHPQEP